MVHGQGIEPTGENGQAGGRIYAPDGLISGLTLGKPPWHPKPATADALRRLGRFAVFSVSAFRPVVLLSVVP